MPACIHCGGTDFVWAGSLRTGTIGRGTLSLRAGGELPLGTRLCRNCGHADLFVRDPKILREPHTWRPGEFVPVVPAPPVPKPQGPPSPSPPPTPAPVPAGSASTPAPVADAPAEEAPALSATEAKRPPRKRSPRTKAPPPPTLEG